MAEVFWHVAGDLIGDGEPSAVGEDKATIAGAGNRTSGPVLRSGIPPLAEQEAWAWLAGTQLVRAGGAAALRSEEAAARACLHTLNVPGRNRRDTRAATVPSRNS